MGDNKNFNVFKPFLDDFIGSKIASRAGETLFLRKSRFFHDISKCAENHEKIIKKSLKINKKTLKIMEKSLKNYGFYHSFKKIAFFDGFSMWNRFVLKFQRF